MPSESDTPELGEATVASLDTARTAPTQGADISDMAPGAIDGMLRRHSWRNPDAKSL